MLLHAGNAATELGVHYSSSTGLSKKRRMSGVQRKPYLPGACLSRSYWQAFRVPAQRLLKSDGEAAVK